MTNRAQVSTAECERDFSTLGRIKTKLRSGLTQNHLDDLMRISSNGDVSEEQLARA